MHIRTRPRPSLRSLFDELPPDSRFLSCDGCRALSDRVFAMATGGGYTFLDIDSRWQGNLRWARNMVTTGGDSQNTRISVSRTIRGASTNGTVSTNVLDDAMLRTALQRAEQMVLLHEEDPEQYPDTPAAVHPHVQPAIWFDRSYDLGAAERGKVAEPLIATAASAGLLSAGYIEVSAFGASVVSSETLFRYYPYTRAQYSITMRDEKNTGSGWAGVDFSDWGRIDAEALTRIAIEKCQRSRDPVPIEPGRYTAILEPQAVCDLFAPILDAAMDRMMAEQGMGPFAAGQGVSKIGQQLLDRRLTVSADPMDPDLGFAPFDWSGEPYLKTNWFENGVLKELSYPRFYGLQQLNNDWALPNSRAFRLSGGMVPPDDMIAATARGVLVTRFNNIRVVDFRSMLLSGNTRDGLWLIESGKVTKAIKNFRFTESPLYVFNNIESLGVPQRVFRPDAPAVCPALTVRDFSFTGLMDAV